MNKLTVNVIGLGYIGLPTALIMACESVQVIGTDLNVSLVDGLNNGILPFKEEGLEDLFKNAIQNNIVFEQKYVNADIYIVAVPTPYIKENKKIDPQFIISAITSILKVCSKGSIICIESTISPSTIDNFVRPIIANNNFIIGKDIHLVHTPERIIPGNMFFELKNNSRTIGCDDVEIGNKIKDLYSLFCIGEIVITDICSAEMSKIVENTFRDVNIAFANELSKICRNANLDVYEIIKLANMHPRVNILTPGPGVGGHCISVDPWFLVGDYPNLTKLISNARQVNDSMPYFVFDRLKCILKENSINDTSRVGVYGLTYKEDVDDIRESPSLQFINVLKENNINDIKFFDPFIDEPIVNNQLFNFDEFISNIDIIIIMVAHSHIKENIEITSNKIILDTKNIFNKNVYKL